MSVKKCEKRVIIATLVAALCWGTDLSFAAEHGRREVTKETVLQWVEQYRSATPDFHPGDTVTAAQLDKVRPFLPPGFIDEFSFPEAEFQIAPSGDYTPHRAYREATEKFSGQTRLAPDGALAGYAAGQPFPNDTLDPNDPQAGLKAAWNFNFRWQHYGQRTGKYFYLFMRPGERAATGQEVPSDAIEGRGGLVERVLWQRFQRVYFTHLAMHPENDHAFPTADARSFEFKDYLEFTDPYEVRGQRMVIHRPADPHEPDQSWTYVPALRKVRRFSAEEKSDSFVGSEQTLDDFYGFSGRVLDWNWKFHGWKEILHIMNSRYPHPRHYGPKGRAPYDRWELRKCAVMEMTPKDPRHPYSSKITFWDAQTYQAAVTLAFDREGKLWKMWQPQISWSEEPGRDERADRGVFVSRFGGTPVIDVKNDQSTLFITLSTDYPKVTPAQVQGLFDVNKLTEGKR